MISRTIIVAATTLIGAAGAHAQFHYFVNEFWDAHDHDLTDGLLDADPLAPGDQCTLRVAIENANYNGGWAIVHVPPGYYLLTDWGTDDTSRRGDLDIYSSTLTRFELIGAPGVTIDASGLGAFPDRVLDALPTCGASSIRLENLVLHGGSGVARGGGLRLEPGPIPIEMVGLELRSCYASDGGGAWVSTGATIHWSGGGLLDNGAAFAGGGLYAQSATILMSNLFVMNNAAQTFGGGMRILSGQADISGTQFLMNSSATGAAMAVRTAVTVSGSDFAQNTAGGTGGAVEYGLGSNLTLERCRFTQNSAQNGGAIAGSGTCFAREIECSMNQASIAGGAVNNSGFFQAEQSTIDHNVCHGNVSGGGGIYNFGAMILANSTLSTNSAPFGRGGAMFLAGPQLSGVHACTIAGNIGGAGAMHIDAIFGAPVIDIRSSFLCDNWDINGMSANFGAAPGSPNMVSAGHNIDTDGTCQFNATGDVSGSSALLMPGLIGPLQNNGGFAQTHELLPGSPAIDTGDCIFPVDERGLLRAGPCDAGAFESAHAQVPCPRLIDQVVSPTVGYFSDPECPACAPGTGQSVAEDFRVLVPATLQEILVHGGNYPAGVVLPTDAFRVRIAHGTPTPGAVIYEECDVAVQRAITPMVLSGVYPVYEYRLSLRNAVTLAPGRYTAEVINDTTGQPATWFWVAGSPQSDPIHAFVGASYDEWQAPGVTWTHDPTIDLSLIIECTPSQVPCMGDLDGDQSVGFGDLLLLLTAWGPGCSGADLDGDGLVGFNDLLLLLTAWGPCP